MLWRGVGEKMKIVHQMNEDREPIRAKKSDPLPPSCACMVCGAPFRLSAVPFIIPARRTATLAQSWQVSSKLPSGSTSYSLG